jgi:hypothetical protein
VKKSSTENCYMCEGGSSKVWVIQPVGLMRMCSEWVHGVLAGMGAKLSYMVVLVERCSVTDVNTGTVCP